MRKICIFILSIVLLCAGCQKTPEAPIVVGKDQQQMIEKAQEGVSYGTGRRGWGRRRSMQPSSPALAGISLWTWTPR